MDNLCLCGYILVCRYTIQELHVPASKFEITVFLNRMLNMGLNGLYSLISSLDA